ncbi:MAG: type I methionyl aminopeptidase [Bacteroidia bacterium]|nr:type I methionyl aminopeptidase [Bacteroidia bacterium]
MTIKNSEEIELIKSSCNLVSLTLALLGQYIAPGITTQRLDSIAEEFIRDHGAIPAFKNYKPDKDHVPYPCTICTSINEEVVHGIPSAKVVLKEGDIVSIDCGVVWKGYYGDAAYTFAVGEIDSQKEKLLQVTLQALYVGISCAKEGARIGDVSSAIQQHVENHGFSVVREMMGHGIGKNLHEPPEIPNFGKRGCGMVLQAGMILAIEPMVNMGRPAIKKKKDGWTIVALDSLPSAHYEHTILVTKDKAQILTNFDYIQTYYGKTIFDTC